ncbi:hypothetical protein H2248_002761 [Termitomyces sp. 'cryptogamus']|nr:hypothetical protein H2248_002761 [Termitomyces sp. 'cryptogamus']
MNGFQTRKPGSDRYSTIHLDDLEIYLRNGDITITEDELKDRSKGDWFSKSILMLQVTWFILQILVRVVQHLAMTELEIATCGFAILNFMTYYFWWNKPFDVDCPIIIPAYHESDASSATPELRSSSAPHTEADSIVGRGPTPSHSQSELTLLNSQSSRECDDNINSNHNDVTHLNASRSLESSESFEGQASNSDKDNGYTSNGPAITMLPALSIPNQVILHEPDAHPCDDVSDINVPDDVPGEGVIHNKNNLASNASLQINSACADSLDILECIMDLQSAKTISTKVIVSRGYMLTCLWNKCVCLPPSTSIPFGGDVCGIQEAKLRHLRIN